MVRVSSGSATGAMMGRSTAGLWVLTLVCKASLASETFLDSATIASRRRLSALSSTSGRLATLRGGLPMAQPASQVAAQRVTARRRAACRRDVAVACGCSGRMENGVMCEFMVVVFLVGSWGACREPTGQRSGTESNGDIIIRCGDRCARSLETEVGMGCMDAIKAAAAGITIR